MQKKTRYRSTFLASLIIVAVLSLIPLPGFITLGIPDDTEGHQMMLSQSIPDVTKRTGDYFQGIDSGLLDFDVVLAIYTSRASLPSLTNKSPGRNCPNIGIRGPPIISCSIS